MITRELTAQYEGIRRVTLTRGQRTDTAGDAASEVIVAILDCTKPLKEAERTRIQSWLKVRLGAEQVEVIVNNVKK